MALAVAGLEMAVQATAAGALDGGINDEFATGCSIKDIFAPE